jgi:hypothetical protein
MHATENYSVDRDTWQNPTNRDLLRIHRRLYLRVTRIKKSTSAANSIYYGFFSHPKRAFLHLDVRDAKR